MIRRDVQLLPSAAGAQLVDTKTGLVANFDEGAAEVLSLLKAHGEAPAVARVLHAAQPDAELPALTEEIERFVAQLSQLGLCDEALSEAQLRARQAPLLLAATRREVEAELSAALAHAYRSAPFIKARVDAAQVAPDALNAETLRRLPPMTKADLRREFPHALVPDSPEVKARLRSGALSLFATSGSTDERLEVLFDWEKGELPASYPSLWGVEPGSLRKGAIFTTPVCAGFECTLGLKTLAERTRGSTVTLNSLGDPFALTEQHVRAFVAEVAEFQPDVLFTHPVYATLLVRRAQAAGLALPRFKVVLVSYQLATAQERRLLASAFGCRVFSYYGATDLGGALIGAECTHGRLHERNDHVFLEVLEGGALTLTPLKSPHLPLVRYQVGDLAALDAEPCDCPAGGVSRTFRLLGRGKDRVTLSTGASVTPYDVDAALGSLSGFDLYRVVQTAPLAFELEVVPAPGQTPPLAECTAALQQLLGAEVKVKARAVRRIPQQRSLKTRLLEPLT
ncbi:MAG: phenylacetate--CoA ligase family protein [Archangiaceae bacterium]|nr:phenylacetate--CoA ligase family protein [Archangiaceae bacterium]